MKAIFLLRCLIKSIERFAKIFIWFIDFEKTYYMFLWSLCGDFWKKKNIKYTKLIEEMYNKIVVYVGVRTSGQVEASQVSFLLL